MKKYFFILFLLPVALFGQTQADYLSFVPTGLKVKPLLNSNNYIDKNAQLAIIQYLQSNNINPQNYFVDSLVVRSGDTLFINVWDIYGLKNVKLIEKRQDSLDRVNSRSNGKKLKIPKPVGNPGNCFTAYFDTKGNILIAAEHWQ
jgi:hypothetical protein